MRSKLLSSIRMAKEVGKGILKGESSKFFKVPKGYTQVGKIGFSPSEGVCAGGKIEVPILRHNETTALIMYTEPVKEVCPLAAEEVEKAWERSEWVEKNWRR